MAGLKEQAVWENEIYQIEENDPVHGGADGITNKPTKQLANRTLYLRNLLTLAGQKIVPKTITATSTNTADETGHTHAIAHGNTTQKGIVQTTSDTGLDSEELAFNAKGAKILAQQIAQNQQAIAGLKGNKVDKTAISDSVSSNSRTHVGSSFAVKTAHDKALQAERLASLYSAEVADNVHCDRVMDGMFVTRVGTPNNVICYVQNLKYKNSQSRGQIAISYWDATPKMWIRNKYDSEAHFSAWRQIDGTDWDDIRNKVNASTTLRGLAQYNDAIDLNSNDFAASSKAVKILNDKKQDKLVEQTISLVNLDPNKWYPVVFKMPNTRRLCHFEVRHTLYDGNNPPWGTHAGGFSAFCRWEAHPSGWGGWSGYRDMRVVHQFDYTFCAQSPILKVDQISEANYEYCYLRGGTSYTVKCEADVEVELGSNGYMWRYSNPQYNRHLPIITAYDASLVPKTNRQALQDGIDSKVSKAGDTMTGRLTLPQVGHGAYNAQYNSGAPLFIDERGSVARDTYHPFVKGKVRAYGQYGAAFSFGYTTRQGSGDGFGRGVIHLIEDNGTNVYWGFEHNGDFVSAADVVADNGYRLKKTHQVGLPHVQVTTQNYGGLKIERPDRNDRILIETENDRLTIIRRNRATGANHYVVGVPTKSGTLLLEGDLGAKTKSLVSRRDYSRRINGTAAGQTGNQMDVVGSVTIYPDGRITQILHLKHFRDLWFQYEDDAVGYGNGTKGLQIPLQLWTAMPNKVMSVQAQLVRATHPTSSVVYGGGEAGEHVCAWDLRKQGASRDRVTINMSRFRGQHSEHIDMYVVVEGY